MDWQKVGERVLTLFEELTQIPHCSGKTAQLRQFIIDWAEERGYRVEVDGAGNIFASKMEKPVVTLQSHYDMVCVGKAPQIELRKVGDWIEGVDSSIGADNGLGVATMLVFMELFPEVGYLFTNDEEIGLVGAFNLELDIPSQFLLNLDGADFRVYIGSAGGETFVIDYPVRRVSKRGSKGILKLEGLPGGHSGEDISKPVPNAIKEWIARAGEIISIKGGERDNAIPQWCEGEIFIPMGKEWIEVITSDFTQFLTKLPHGVIKWDPHYSIPRQSANLAKVDNGKVVLSIRGNTPSDLEELEKYVISLLEGCKWEVVGKYPPWPPSPNRLSQLLSQKIGHPPRVIHAGLECGVFSAKFPHLQIASFGPIIQNLHSTRERFLIPSLFEFVKVVGESLEELGDVSKK
jgi:dipeptidase D